MKENNKQDLHSSGTYSYNHQICFPVMTTISKHNFRSSKTTILHVLNEHSDLQFCTLYIANSPLQTRGCYSKHNLCIEHAVHWLTIKHDKWKTFFFLPQTTNYSICTIDTTKNNIQAILLKNLQTRVVLWLLYPLGYRIAPEVEGGLQWYYWCTVVLGVALSSGMFPDPNRKHLPRVLNVEVIL